MAVVALVAMGRVAIADPAPGPERPRFYNTLSTGVAILHTEDPGRPSSTVAYLVGRVSLGVELGPRGPGFDGRIGAFVDAYFHSFTRQSVDYGMEALGDWSLGPDWRVGVRLAVGARGKGGNVEAVGVYARHAHVHLGIDALRQDDSRGSNYHWSSNGVVMSAGLEGRPALIGTGIVAVVGAIWGALILRAVANS